MHGSAANTLFESVLHGPARLEGVGSSLPRGFIAPLCIWLSLAVKAALSA